MKIFKIARKMHNRNIVRLLFILLFYSEACAQNIEWEVSLGGSGDDLNNFTCQTLDSGFLVVGYTSSNDGDVVGFHPGNCTSTNCYDMWVVKLNKFGIIEWSKSLGGSMIDIGRCAALSGSGYLIAGSSSSNDGDVSGNHGGSDAWIVKLDSSGGILWQKCIGGIDNDLFQSIIGLPDHSIIAFGSTFSNDSWVQGNHGGQDFWLVKMDSAANIIWQSCYGGGGEELSFSMKQTSDQGFILCGFTNSTDGQPSIPFGRDRQYWLLKTDSMGSMLWNNNYGGSLDDWCTDVVETNDGGFMLTGLALSTNYDVTNRHDVLMDDGWVVKTDNVGNIVWQHAMGGTLQDEFYSIIRKEDSSYVTSGFTISNDDDVSGNHSTREDVWLVQFSEQGIIESQKCFGGPYSDESQKIIQTFDNGFALSCNTYGPGFDVSSFHGGHTDFWVLKLGPIITSIKESDKNNIRLFPIPAHEYISFENLILPQRVSIFSISGKKLKDFSVKANNDRLNISDLSTGVYILKTTDGRVQKIVKY
ncbi:MAG: T9SS type A sorting domain-containing protein [Bacteroidetes bacterium]|nr:T9SS type A sorting domain-containing protein [Bacteroidota bacterium]MBL0063593.1 T9SS type A sorting domain-containing protein [Bacteroidota bacterium]MBL0139979.1 T9SS type A sorting domain-containing protein [Bacteroidota bacterium]